MYCAQKSLAKKRNFLFFDFLVLHDQILHVNTKVIGQRNRHLPIDLFVLFAYVLIHVTIMVVATSSCGLIFCNFSKFSSVFFIVEFLKFYLFLYKSEGLRFLKIQVQRIQKTGRLNTFMMPLK